MYRIAFGHCEGCGSVGFSMVSLSALFRMGTHWVQLGCSILF